MRSPPGSPPAPEAQALYRPDVGPSAAQSRAAAERRARLDAEAEQAERQQWAVLAPVAVPEEEPALPQAERLVRVELARQGALA
ncbi:MAG TPA: hypothetical protein VJN48_17040, partial [Terriglobales bacterium]|nr:hypothetical protein [Terriglobales bacterium]